MTVGQNIKRLRTQAGLSQRALALALGTTQNQVFLWETEKFQPSLASFGQLCEFFKCDARDLLL